MNLEGQGSRLANGLPAKAGSHARLPDSGHAWRPWLPPLGGHSAWRPLSGGRCRNQHGYAMTVLLIGIAVMGILATAALPVWKQAAKREKEAELIFRGEQYARAVGLFQRKFGGAFPPNIDVLIEQKFLRKKYKDPITKDGEFRLLYQSGPPGVPTPGAGGPQGTPATTPTPQTPTPAVPGLAGGRGALGAQGGVIGVVSKSKDTSIRVYKGRNRYEEWQFVYTPVAQAPTATPGSLQPGQTPGSVPMRPGPSRPPTPGPRPGSPRPGLPGFPPPSPRP